MDWALNSHLNIFIKNFWKVACVATLDYFKLNKNLCTWLLITRGHWWFFFNYLALLIFSTRKFPPHSCKKGMLTGPTPSSHPRKKSKIRSWISQIGEKKFKELLHKTSFNCLFKSKRLIEIKFSYELWNQMSTQEKDIWASDFGRCLGLFESILLSFHWQYISNTINAHVLLKNPRIVGVK